MGIAGSGIRCASCTPVFCEVPLTETSYRIRAATVAEAAVLGAHRAAMFREVGRTRSEAAETALRDVATQAIQAAMAAGVYLGWLAERAEPSDDLAEAAEASPHPDRTFHVIGSASVYLQATLPRPSGDGMGVVTGPTPLVVDVYTHPNWRRRGVARSLMQALLAWAESAGMDRVRLHAAEAGRPLYEQLGFHSTNEMLWTPGE
jgi:GNAT superfamily N-acetyltransferase